MTEQEWAEAYARLERQHYERNLEHFNQLRRIQRDVHALQDARWWRRGKAIRRLAATLGEA